MLDPYQEEEDDVRRGYSDEAIEEEEEDTEDFALDRPEQLEEYLTEQGVLGGVVDPCTGVVTPPAKEGPAVTPVGPPPPPATGKIWIGSSRVLGSFVSTRLNVPGAGKATQRVTTWLDGHRVQACAGEKMRATGGRMTVRCHLSKRVREAFDEGLVKLRVRVGFVPASGAPEFEIHRLPLPKRR